MRPSVPLDRLSKRSRYAGAGASARQLDPASRALWLGLGVLLVVLVFIAVQARPHKAPTTPPSAAASMTRPVDGVACVASTATAPKTAVHLNLFLRGKAVTLPAQIGVFSSAGCGYALQTTDTSGIIHISGSGAAPYTLGTFFDIWGMPLTSKVLMGFQATPGAGGQSVRAFVDGRPYAGDPRGIPLRPHAEITLEYGPPWVPAPSSYAFPKGT